MPRFSRRQKDAAAANHDTALRIAAFSGFFTVAAAAIPGVGPLLALAPAAAGAAYTSRAIAQGKIVRDPPDPDFRSPVRLGSVELNLGQLGSTPFESTVGALALSNERAAALARAVVRSLERAMGAEQAGEEGYVRSHLYECEVYAERFAAELSMTSDLAVAARETLAELPSLGPVVRGSGLVLQNLLPDETLAGLYRMGVRRSYVSEPLQAPAVDGHLFEGDAKEGWGRLLSQAGEADADYAAEVRRQLETGTFWLENDAREQM
jgi:hypothetical protein